MLDHYGLISFIAGISFTLCVEGLLWLYWRYWGAGSLWAYISEDEEPEGNYRVIKRLNNPTQKIALVEQDGYFYVFANGTEMFSTADGEDQYAEALVHLPLAVAHKLEKVLIIGSGAGISTREALRYPEVREITAVDVDATIMDLGKNFEPFVRFTQGSLNNPRVRTVIQDGREFLENSLAKWDAIIIDLPEPSISCPELARLFSVEFYQIVKEHLEPGGILNVACSASSEMPAYFWAVQATLKAAGFYVLPYHFDFIVEWGQDWGFSLAATRPLAPSDVEIKISTRYLNEERLQDMLRIPYYLSGSWDSKKIQTDRNNLLAELVEESWEK